MHPFGTAKTSRHFSAQIEAGSGGLFGARAAGPNEVLVRPGLLIFDLFPSYALISDALVQDYDSLKLQRTIGHRGQL